MEKPLSCLCDLSLKVIVTSSKNEIIVRIYKYSPLTVVQCRVKIVSFNPCRIYSPPYARLWWRCRALPPSPCNLFITTFITIVLLDALNYILSLHIYQTIFFLCVRLLLTVICDGNHMITNHLTFS